MRPRSPYTSLARAGSPIERLGCAPTAISTPGQCADHHTNLRTGDLQQKQVLNVLLVPVGGYTSETRVYGISGCIGLFVVFIVYAYDLFLCVLYDLCIDVLPLWRNNNKNI